MKAPPKRTRTQAGLGQVKAPAERGAADDEVLLINAPSPSSRDPEGPKPRHTRAIESVRRHSREVQKAQKEQKDRTDSKPPPSASDRRTIDEAPTSAARGARASLRPPASGKGAGRKGRGNSLAPPSGRKAEAAPASIARSKRPSIREDHVGTVKSGNAGSRVPKVLKTKAEIAEAPIDHRAGFLLAHVDGTITVQALVDIAGMPEEDVHEILERLRRLGIIAFR